MASKVIFRLFSGKINYYEVLGIQPSAHPEEVKKAYREMVKKLHPDVVGTSTSEEKFRMVTEAYAVLSKLESRATYDLTRGSKQEIESILEKKRDKDGLDVAKVKFAPHQYGYNRMKELAEERKRFNMDKFFRYRGGLPQKHLGKYRGDAYGSPGTRADLYELNYITKGNNFISNTTNYISDEQVNSYKLSRTTELPNLIASKPFLRAEIDYNFTKFQTIRSHLTFYISILAFFGFLHVANEIPKLNLKMVINRIQNNAEISGKPFEKVGMRGVSLS